MMERASFFRVVIKDLIDFTIIFLTTFALTFGVYFLIPSFMPIDVSFYFLEQVIEVFFFNPKLTLWFLGFSFGVTVMYYLFSLMLGQTTVGGIVAGLTFVDKATKKPISIVQIVVMAFGAYVGVLFFFIGPLSAWWLDHETRGFSEKWSQVLLVKNNLRAQNASSR